MEAPPVYLESVKSRRLTAVLDSWENRPELPSMQMFQEDVMFYYCTPHNDYSVYKMAQHMAYPKWSAV